METFIGQFGQYSELLMALIGVCAAVAALIPAPTEQSGKVYQIFYRIINTLAANVRHARNASDKQ